MRKISLLIITIMFVLFGSTLTVSAASPQSNINRYTVLVLDTSDISTFYYDDEEIYTADTAIDYVKAASSKFLDSVRAASGNNYVAVVSYKEDADVISGFTTNYNNLKSKINALSADDEVKDMAYGIYEAMGLLEDISDQNAIKNIVLFSTGMTNSGDYDYDGFFDDDSEGSTWYRTDTDIHLYAYANVAIQAAEEAKEKGITVYSIGLFQTMEDIPEEGEDVAELFRTTAEEIASSIDYFYPVYDPEDLEFTFGDVADDIYETSITISQSSKNISTTIGKTIYISGELVTSDIPKTSDIQWKVTNTQNTGDNNVTLGSISITSKGNNTYTFTMPMTFKEAGTYNIEAIFKNLKDTCKVNVTINQPTPTNPNKPQNGDNNQNNIPANNPYKNYTGEGITPLTIPISTISKRITKSKNEEIKGASYPLLQAKATNVKAASFKVKWNKLPGATKYLIYGNKCGIKNRFQYITQTTNNWYKPKKLKKKQFYKYVIVGVMNDKVISISKTVHVGLKPNPNPTKVKVNKKSVTLVMNKKLNTIKISHKIKGTKLKQHRNIRCETDNIHVARINNKGKITAVGPGKCNVYIYAQNGVSAKIAVTVVK